MSCTACSKPFTYHGCTTGKAYALFYLLARRLSSGLPTIYAYADSAWFLFCAEGAYLLRPVHRRSFSRDLARIRSPAEATAILQRPFVVLFASDAGDSLPTIRLFDHWAYIVASLRNGAPSGLGGEAQGGVLGDENVVLGRGVRSQRISVGAADQRRTFSLFSHAARVVYATPAEERSSRVESALRALTPQDLAALILGDADTSGLLTEVNPPVTSAGRILSRSGIVRTLATPSILDPLVWQPATAQHPALRRAFDALYADPETRASAGTAAAFKLAAHAVLTRPSRREVRALSDGSVSSIDISCRSPVLFDVDRGLDPDAWRDARAGRLYCTPRGGLAGIDAFAVVRGGTPVVFQMSVARTPVDLSGLDDVARLLGLPRGQTKKWALVFVVPKHGVDTFEARVVNAPDECGNWDRVRAWLKKGGRKYEGLERYELSEELDHWFTERQLDKRLDPIPTDYPHGSGQPAIVLTVIYVEDRHATFRTYKRFREDEKYLALKQEIMEETGLKNEDLPWVTVPDPFSQHPYPVVYARPRNYALWPATGMPEVDEDKEEELEPKPEGAAA
ncbi:hypothetical protein BKA93DRAFT_823787 [Sparassis latifolia]